MFRRTQMTAAMSQELMDELTDHGRRDLSQLPRDDREWSRCPSTYHEGHEGIRERNVGCHLSVLSC